MIVLKLCTVSLILAISCDICKSADVNYDQLTQQIFGRNPNLNAADIQNDKLNVTQSSEGWDLNDDFIPTEGAPDENFDWALFKALSASNPEDNLLLSPISVKILLMMLNEGARGATQQELRQILQLPENQQLIRERVAWILASLKTQSPDYTLNFASRLFISRSIETRQRFSAIVKMFYDTDLVSVDFMGDKTETEYEINSWARNVTSGYLQRLVTGDDLENAVLIMLNAIFFRGQWRKQFPTENTKIGEFHVQPDRIVNVPLMRQQGVFFYVDSKELDARILRLPYKGRKYSMFVILPNTIGGLSKLTQDINSETLRKHMWLMDERELNVTLPKFKFDYTAQLKQVLQKLGLNEIFSPTASLPGIARGLNGDTRLVVSNLIQKSGIDVSEEGSTVYAATEIVLTNKFGSDTDSEFKANRPFIFTILDEISGTILFTGRVLDPSKTLAEDNQQMANEKININQQISPIQNVRLPYPMQYQPQANVNLG